MMTTNLRLAYNEKDVENFYRQYLSKKFGDILFTSPFGCDGYGESEKYKVRILCEFKDNLDLISRVNQIKVLSQAIYYIKKFEISGKILPSVIFIGDRNECFAIHTNDVFKYLSMDFDWNISPSKAHTNVDLISLLIEDQKIIPHIFSVNDIDNCIDKIKDLTDGVKRLIPITPHNITEVFRYFEKKVIGKHNLDTNKLANLFIQLLINPDENYLHPVTRRKTIVTKAFNEVNLKSREIFTSFFDHFSRDYSPKQKEHLTAVVDRLVEDVTRRKQGEFFTPDIWVRKAHEYIESVFGENWKDNYVVWDPAWGTGNLTRGYKFRELYVSTLIYSDIETANQMGYNPEATKFQYDILNDPYEYLPKGLRDAIESGKKIIVLMNPPYGRTTGEKGRFSSITIGATSTGVSKKMKKEKISGSDNFYTQFLYQTLKLGIKNICCFTPSNFQTGESFKTFREYFYNEVDLKKGFIFQASNFADVTDDWAVQFSVFQNGKMTDKNQPLDILDLEGNFQVKKVGQKEFYSTDEKKSLKNWIVPDDKSLIIDFPKLSSPFNVKETNWGFGLDEKSFASLVCNANSPAKNAQSVYIVNGGVGENVGKIYINEKNFLKSVSVFSVRRLIQGDWLNWYDEYMIPDESNLNLLEFINDSIVYSLFESKSNQSSLRQITYKNQDWNIKNQFFWMSKEEMMELANQNNYTELYNDARTEPNRYVHDLLFGEQRIYDQLSDEAKDVLDTATNLVRISMGMRINFADNTNHLNSWDAGYAQLKLLWKEYFPVQFKEFREKYKVLEDKMRPMVYELGFLLK